jgi:hypothetical protein
LFEWSGDGRLLPNFFCRTHANSIG